MALFREATKSAIFVTPIIFTGEGKKFYPTKDVQTFFSFTRGRNEKTSSILL